MVMRLMMMMMTMLHRGICCDSVMATMMVVMLHQLQSRRLSTQSRMLFYTIQFLGRKQVISINLHGLQAVGD
jgi:hypothetical protein